jgi:hypothetical protein
MTTRKNGLDPALDITGSMDHSDSLDLSNESSFFGTPLPFQTGSVASITAHVDNVSTFAGLTGMSGTSVGRYLTVSGADTPGNNGTLLIVAFNSTTSVDVLNTSGAAPDANNGSISWIEREAYTLEDDLNYARTDRAGIKGVAYDDDVPDYQRPDAVGTDVPANLNNLAGETLDAHATVRNVRDEMVRLNPTIADGDGNVLISDETFTTTNYHFTADDVDNFITLTDGTAVGATGIYRIKTVTDGQTLELDGLNATGAGTVTWVRESDIAHVDTSRRYADSVNRTGLPIADSGAEDEVFWDATYVEMYDDFDGAPLEGIEDEAGDRIFGRAFGDEKDPNRTLSNEFSRLFIQLYTGLNDGTATESLLEPISGRSGSAASLPGGNKNITGLTGMTSADIDRYIQIWNLASDEAGNYRILSIVSPTEVTVERDAGNFTADASGAIEWHITRHSGHLIFFYGDRFRNDNLSETWARHVLIDGSSSGTSELVIDIDEIRETIGISDGDTDLDGLLTNLGNYYPFNDLPDATPSVVEALNTLNEQIGDRDYDGTILTDGETITESLQALADNSIEALIITTWGGLVYQTDGTLVLKDL